MPFSKHNTQRRPRQAIPQTLGALEHSERIIRKEKLIEALRYE
jgi:hypothetical protein